jgi:hypothetical protein
VSDNVHIAGHWRWWQVQEAVGGGEAGGIMWDGAELLSGHREKTWRLSAGSRAPQIEKEKHLNYTSESLCMYI